MSGESRGSIHAIIPARDKATFIASCVGSVVEAARHRPGTSIVLIENGSSDGTAEAAERLFGNAVEVLRSMATTAAEARNEGAARKTTGILCFLDADVQVPPDYFVRIDRVFQAGSVDAAGCTVETPDTAGWITKTWGRLHWRGAPSLGGMINAGNFAARADAFHHVGGFDASLVTGEDADLCLRMIERGYHLLETPELGVIHHDNPESIAHFVAKEVWHGLGAAATVRISRIDRPFLMTLAHGLLVIGSLVPLVLHPGAATATIAAVAALGVPIVTVAYRRTLAASPPGWVPSVVLYELYFFARLVALFRTGIRRRTS